VLYSWLLAMNVSLKNQLQAKEKSKPVFCDEAFFDIR
jgi:hypothetical protein